MWCMCFEMKRNWRFRGGVACLRWFRAPDQRLGALPLQYGHGGGRLIRSICLDFVADPSGGEDTAAVAAPPGHDASPGHAGRQTGGLRGLAALDFGGFRASRRPFRSWWRVGGTRPGPSRCCLVAQVERGLPLCGMGISAQKEDVRVRAIALLAERTELEPGEVWRPVSDLEPAGPFFGVLVAGRVMVEIGQEMGRMGTVDGRWGSKRCGM